VEFVCGYRALATARADYATLGKAAELLSCGLPEVPAVLAKIIEERRAQHGAVKRLEERLAEHEARELLVASTAHAPGGLRRVVAALDGASAAYLAFVAAKMAAEAEVVVLLASRATGHVVFAQSKGGARDMGSLLRTKLGEFGGKGGGAKDFARGSLPDASRIDAFLARASQAIA
jgi:alanyl-tRNA synthetase